MAEQLKDFYGKRVVAELARDIAAVHPKFDAAGFQAACLQGLDRLELLARAWQIAEALHDHLPAPFGRASKILIRSLGPEYDEESGQGRELKGMEPFRYLPHVFFASKYGLADSDFDAAMQLQYELTKRFTAEFSIRAYIQQHPERTYQRLGKWARDENHHVRRLVSEGTRPRLPWAPRLKEYQKDPTPVIALLELLKDDPDLYVRRSVANNLNDISKDHPERAVSVARQWQKGADEDRLWIIRHALRGLVKRGHPGALALQGFGGKPRVAIRGVEFMPRLVRIGEKVRFRFQLASTGKRRQTLLVDFAVHFVKANGSAAPKVFKLKRIGLGAGETAELGSTVSFAQHTTRKHYPGRHKFELLVNGQAIPLGEIQVGK